MSFSDPEIIELLKTKFVPVAIDQWYQCRQSDAEGDYYRKVACGGKAAFEVNRVGTTQGLYASTADGQLLGSINHRDPNRVKDLLKRALQDFRAAPAAIIEDKDRDKTFVRTPPEGGLVINVTAKILGGWSPNDRRSGWAHEAFIPNYQESLGRERMWVRKDEAEALAKGKVSESLKRRMARFHLIENTYTDTVHPWKETDLRKVELKLAEGRLEGTVHLETDSGDKGFQGELFGFVVAEGEKVTRFDIVAKGLFWGKSRIPTYPKGKFPFAVAFTLAGKDEEADKVPPLATKAYLSEYLR